MKKFLVLFLAVLVLAAGGCGKSQEALLKESIMQYNKNLVIALKSDPEVLKKYAVERELGRI